MCWKTSSLLISLHRIAEFQKAASAIEKHEVHLRRMKEKADSGANALAEDLQRFIKSPKVANAQQCVAQL